MVQAPAGVSELAKALAKAQGAFPSIPKNKTTTVKTKTGGQYTYNYADLPSILDLTRKHLSENGLSIAQMTIVHDGAMMLLTRLMHSSGEYIEATYPLPINATAQDMGSAITYARRYSLSPLIGIAPDDDDDGKAAQENDVRPSTPPPKPVFHTDPRKSAKEAAKEKAEERKAGEFPANICVKSIAPGESNGIKYAILETTGGRFVVMGDHKEYGEIMARAQQSAMGKMQAIVEYHLNAKKSNVVDSFKLEG